MNKKSLLAVVVLCCLIWPVRSQTGFDVSAYYDYLASHADISEQSLMQEYADDNIYFRGLGEDQPETAAAYYDSVVEKFRLTQGELALLHDNYFVVTERLSFGSFGDAMHSVYNYDLPVFVSTDAVLYALHASYDQVLMEIEIELLQTTLEQMLQDMYHSIPGFKAAHPEPELQTALADVDLYITMALSLLREEKLPTQTDLVDNFDEVWNAIGSEQAVGLKLFADVPRVFDFSQFTPRGHYTHIYWDGENNATLSAYFKSMMWLGRIDFWLTPPPATGGISSDWGWRELQRPARAVLMMNELMDLAGAWSDMQEMDKIITFFVGESDNLMPAQLASVMDEHQITLESIADSAGVANFGAILSSSEEYGQKILSSIIMMDPWSNEPGVLPISYKLMGQRFIIDSYVLGNVVFDRIVYHDQKILRMMPNPLDAMFVLGNNNTLPLLKDELDRFHYAQNLAGLRYLVDSYDAEFWQKSLYNVWLGAIRAINPLENVSDYPLFMQSAAWQHKQLNTQLASWAHLRHDNLLYAKQSYTGGWGCSFPHSFVEPYPEFYASIQRFASETLTFFSVYPQEDRVIRGLVAYYGRLYSIAGKLAELARKELDHELFSAEDEEFLQGMLYVGGFCGDPPFVGWYTDMFYDGEDAANAEYTIADVHTEPVDEYGNEVGRILHVGVGKINLGFFLAPSPSNNYDPMIYAGPVMSYYEKITENFKRMTDEEWTGLVDGGGVPARPDWVNIYLADSHGSKMPAGREIPYQLLTTINQDDGSIPGAFALANNYPNPFNPSTTICYTLPTAGDMELNIFDITGRQVGLLAHGYQEAGTHEVTWDAGGMASGVYFYSLRFGGQQIVGKMILLR